MPLREPDQPCSDQSSCAAPPGRWRADLLPESEEEWTPALPRFGAPHTRALVALAVLAVLAALAFVWFGRPEVHAVVERTAGDAGSPAAEPSHGMDEHAAVSTEPASEPRDHGPGQGPGQGEGQGQDEPGRGVPGEVPERQATPASGTAAAATHEGRLVVHVAGQVEQPGVVLLPDGSRVVDAIAAAGGARPKADLAAVNMARPVVDGEQVVLPRRGAPAGGGAGPSAAPGVLAPSGGTPGSAGTTTRLSTASTVELEALPGIGPVLAQRIVAWREEHGGFPTVDALEEVSGIGPAVLEQVRPLVQP